MFGRKGLREKIKELEGEIRRVEGIVGYILRDELSISIQGIKTGEEDLKDVKLLSVVQFLMDHLNIRPKLVKKIKFVGKK